MKHYLSDIQHHPTSFFPHTEMQYTDTYYILFIVNGRETLFFSIF